MISKENRKIIIDFIKYLETDSKKYEFICGGWSYEEPIYNFLDFLLEQKIIIEYKNAGEREVLINKDDNIDIMNMEEIRKYLNALFYSERFHEGIVMHKIKSDKLIKALKRLAFKLLF